MFLPVGCELNNTTWLKLNNASPEQVVVGDMDNSGGDDVIAEFGSGGIFVKRNLGEWVKLHNSNPEGMTIGNLDGSAGDDLVVDFGQEICDVGLSPTEHQRQLAAARDIAIHPDGGARLVYVGPRLSQTGSNADQWLPARPGSEGILALALARVVIESGGGTEQHRELLNGVLRDADLNNAAEKTDLPAETIARLGKALAGSRSPVAEAVCGSRTRLVSVSGRGIGPGRETPPFGAQAGGWPPPLAGPRSARDAFSPAAVSCLPAASEGGPRGQGLGARCGVW